MPIVTLFVYVSLYPLSIYLLTHTIQITISPCEAKTWKSGLERRYLLATSELFSQFTTYTIMNIMNTTALRNTYLEPCGITL